MKRRPMGRAHFDFHPSGVDRICHAEQRVRHLLPGDLHYQSCRLRRRHLNDDVSDMGLQLRHQRLAIGSYVMRGSFNVGRLKPGCTVFQNSVWVMRFTTAPVALS